MSIYDSAENEFVMENYGMTQSPDALIEKDFMNAKAYLLTASTKSGMNLYDHLATVLTSIIEKHPLNPLEDFEEFCFEAKRNRFIYKLDTFLEKKPKSKEVTLAEIQHKMFKIRFWGKLFGLRSNYIVAEVQFSRDVLIDAREVYEMNDADTEADTLSTNVLKPSAMIPTLMPTDTTSAILKFDEIQKVEEEKVVEDTPANRFQNQQQKMIEKMQQLQQLSPQQQLDLLHQQKQQELKLQQLQQQLQQLTPNEMGDHFVDTTYVRKLTADILEESLAPTYPPLPEPFFIKPTPTPPEKPRSGINLKSYFVCSEPGMAWVRLPNATPSQVVTAKKIKKYLTGDLEAPVHSNPLFPGREKHLLRATIARISSATQVSPTGFYQIDEEDAEEEELEDQEAGSTGRVVENSDYEPLTVQELADPTLDGWVHHAPYILDQGRTKWWDPTVSLSDVKRRYAMHRKAVDKIIKESYAKFLKSRKTDEEEIEEEEEEEEIKDDDEEDDQMEPEVGPPLLSPLSEDSEYDGQPAWSVKLSSKLLPQYACAVLQSNIWPGAYAVANNKIFENVYIGWGQKFGMSGYNPPDPFDLQIEYHLADSDELSEISDPTVREEDAWFRAHKPPEEDNEEEVDEEEEEEDSDVLAESVDRTDMDRKRDHIRHRITISSSSSSSSRSRSSGSSRSSSRGHKHRRRSSTRSRSRNNRSRRRSGSRQRDKDYKKSDYIGTNSKDPKMIASRIYIGNMPTDGSVTKEDVENIFKKYGKIIGLLLMPSYAFIQFDNEESANKAREEAGTLLKGHTLEVRLVTERKKQGTSQPDHPIHPEPPSYYPMPPHPGFYPGGPMPPPPPYMHPGRLPLPHFYDPFLRPRGMLPGPPNPPASMHHPLPPVMDPYAGAPYMEPAVQMTLNPPLPPIASTVNKPLAVAIDCDIILVSNEQRMYGESVKTRLLASGLTVEIKILPHDLTTLSMVESAGRKGLLFAIIINDQNEIHRSITVNILHGSPQEHRNMPLDDAITLITRSFDKYVLNKKERLTAAANAKDVFQPPGQNIVYLLNLLADIRFLTVPELDSVLEYLVERRNLLARTKNIPPWTSIKERHAAHPSGHPQQQQQQQHQRMQKHTNDDFNLNHNSTLNAPSHIKEEKSGLSAVFDNPLVQKALNNLLNNGPSILKSINNDSSTNNGAHYQTSNNSNSNDDNASNINNNGAGDRVNESWSSYVNSASEYR
ncbi:hypothetical protein HELRODRAFT_193795 [Helobdella robusta]|uniref:RRM domain-containing protein n=1 Tax=Helobdella robusta TaxID=6412 RepID=T1FVD0_HELRO|nr:hypothetical protein HELRODRAFT_193795 [Helobdella robusta]ESN94806.1 hypothetical protein HELRODRAFT_193795 [Helobdella robusta]